MDQQQNSMWKAQFVKHQALGVAVYFLSVGMVIVGGAMYFLGWLILVLMIGWTLRNLLRSMWNPGDTVNHAVSLSSSMGTVWQEDMMVIRLIRTNYWLLWPFCLSTIANIAFFIYILIRGFGDLNFWGYVAIIFIIMYIMWSIYFIGFLWLGERMQSKFLERKNLFIIDMFKNYLFSIPFLLILTILSVIFFLIPDKKESNRNAVAGLVLIIGALKHFTYINLTRVALDDQRISLREAYTDFSENKINYFNIWMFSGTLLGIPLMITATLAMINTKFLFVNPDVLWLLPALFIVLLILFSLLTEQIRHLFLYLKLYHSDNIKVREFFKV